jgi:acyl-CoA synthetase (AMP-forming)/AMP-acid ligase II
MVTQVSFDLVATFQRHARFLSKKRAIVEDRSCTYSELWDIAGEIAEELLRAGLRAGDRIAVACAPGVDYVLLIVGMLRAELVVCPINTRLTPSEIDAYFTSLNPRAVISDEESLDIAERIGTPLLVLSETGGRWQARTSGPRVPLPSAAADLNGAFIVGTGGSTGIPKGAVISRNAAWMWATCAAFAQQLRQSDVEMFGSPFFHSTLLTGVLSPLVAGATVRVISGFNTDSVVTAVERDGGTRLAGAPTMLQRVLDHATANADLWRNVRVVQFGSTKAPPGFVDRVRQALPGADLITGYGTTEFGPVTRVYTADFLSNRDVGVGRPVPAADVVIVDPVTMRILTAPEAEGEIAVACPWQMTGYAGAKSETKDALLASGHIRSGDIGQFDPEGFLHFRGRYKEIVITGGENVFPIEVERVIADHPSIVDVAVYGVDDDTWGERVEAAVVVRPQTSVTIDEVRDFCRSRLAGFKIPRSLVIYDDLPLTPNSKVDKRRLSEASRGRRDP